ncbi:hypothetical protein BHM03_00058851 [Ensete ventricosum]|nr:hypothetical protein BHM03_00058851 [Ensete ventricosum]
MARGGNPVSIIILQKRFGVGPDVVTSSAWGGWFGSVRCSAFELPDERFCDMGLPSSAKMFVRNLRACPVGAVDVSVEARVLPTAAVACRPYPCQVGRIIVGFAMSGRPRWRSSRPRARGRDTEESAQPSLCQVCKFVHVSWGYEDQAGVGMTSREFVSWVEVLRLRLGWLGTCRKVLSGWGKSIRPL